MKFESYFISGGYRGQSSKQKNFTDSCMRGENRKQVYENKLWKLNSRISGVKS